MFLNGDPEVQLYLYHQRTNELLRQASEYRLARRVRGRHRRYGRWLHRDETAD